MIVLVGSAVWVVPWRIGNGVSLVGVAVSAGIGSLNPDSICEITLHPVTERNKTPRVKQIVSMNLLFLATVNIIT